MYIRSTRQEDLPDIMETFEYAKGIMRSVGNYDQWVDGYPRLSDVQADMEAGYSYVCLSDEAEADQVAPETLLATFCLMKDPDPNYAYIEGPGWLNDQDYVVIHRIATNGKIKGAGRYCLQWVMDRYDNVKIDTHDKNLPMKSLVAKLGYEYCGVIYLADGAPRNAYHYSKNK